MVRKTTTGTREWADSNVNVINGCVNDCRYCYAKKMSIRFKRKTPDTWKDMVLHEKIPKRFTKRNGRIMFPTSHDIPSPLIERHRFLFGACIHVLERMLEAGNNVLITTKPNLAAIEYICRMFLRFQDQIQFRFTITSANDDILTFWEPRAPLFVERVKSLVYAFGAGFKTSISIEPCLDADPRSLVHILRPYVTESIWLGCMNYCGTHEFNKRETLVKWREWFKNDPIIRFKDSVINKLGEQ